MVFTSAGNPKLYTSFLKKHGITVVHVVSSVKFALKAQDAGVDAIVAHLFIRPDIGNKKNWRQMNDYIGVHEERVAFGVMADNIEEETKCELAHSPSKNTKNVALLDTGSTFNSTNNEETLMNTQEAVSPMTSRTNAGQRQMTKCREILEPTEEM